MHPPGPRRAPRRPDQEPARSSPAEEPAGALPVQRGGARGRTSEHPRAFQGRRLGLLLAAACVTASALGLAAYARLQWLLDTPLDPTGAPREFLIRRGESLREVSMRLESEGVLPEHSPLVLWGRLTGLDRQVRAGLYLLGPKQSPREILQVLAQGRTLLLHVSIPEGWTMAQILPRVAEALRVPEAEAVAAATDPALAQSLGNPGPSLEGYLFPETYAFEYGTPVRDALASMVRLCLERLDEPRRKRAAELGMSLHEVLTLASIVQAEAAEVEEMPRIAAVYHNRLRQHRRLEADPTAAYAAGLVGQRLLLSDLRVESPYNTYLQPGLPPGPICSPGLASIDATLYPLEGCEDLFFVARGDGSHIFSRTLEEHERARDAIRRSRPRGPRR